MLIRVMPMPWLSAIDVVSTIVAAKPHRRMLGMFTAAKTPAVPTQHQLARHA